MIKTWHLGYRKARRRAKKIYSKTRTIQCPALSNENISFSSWGFKHLIYKGRIPRTKSEQKRRFVLLPYAKQIIKNPQAVILFREQEIELKPNKKFCSIMGDNVK